MRDTVNDTPPSQPQVDQAIEWLVRLRYERPSAGTEQQFQHWLGSHPQHARAWQRVSDLSDELSSLPSDLSRSTLDGSRRQRMNRREHLKLLGVLAVAGGLGWAAREPLGLAQWLADSHTATGERRRLRSRDGSRIQLNTASAIDLRFSADLRLMTLIHGEVSLESNAQDPRPFRIATRYGDLTTLNGQVLLRDNPNGLLMAVKRGEVTLFTPDSLAHLIAPGDVLQLNGAGQLRPVTLLADPWGWTDGVLSVQQMPLGQFVEELSRYRPGYLRCATSVADLKVSGTYQLADTDQILQLIARSLPISVQYRTRYWVTLGAV